MTERSARVVGLTLVFAIAGWVDASKGAVSFHSQDRFIQTADRADPHVPGPMFPPLVTLGTDVHAPDFNPFTQLTGPLASYFGVSQDSSISAAVMNARGHALASPEFQPPGVAYYHYNTAQSHFEVEFTLDAPMNYTLTQHAAPPGSVVPVSPYTLPIVGMKEAVLRQPGGPTLTFPGAGASPVVYTGTLAAGTWTFVADATSFGHYQSSPIGVAAYDVTLALVPEPTGIVGVLALGYMACRRRHRRAAVTSATRTP